MSHITVLAEIPGFPICSVPVKRASFAISALSLNRAPPAPVTLSAISVSVAVHVPVISPECHVLCWQAVRGMPAGQAADMVQFVADGLPALVDGSPEVAAPLGEVRLFPLAPGTPRLLLAAPLENASGSTCCCCTSHQLRKCLYLLGSHTFGGKSVCQVLLKKRCSYV